VKTIVYTLHFTLEIGIKNSRYPRDDNASGKQFRLIRIIDKNDNNIEHVINFMSMNIPTNDCTCGYVSDERIVQQMPLQ